MRWILVENEQRKRISGTQILKFRHHDSQEFTNVELPVSLFVVRKITFLFPCQVVNLSNQTLSGWVYL